jgi:hypothetical protein
MSFIRNKRAHLAVALGALALGGAVFVGTRIAQADGVPQTQPLTYSGTLLDAAGNPATGTLNVDLNLYTAAMGGSLACATSGQITLVGGRFQLVLDPSCTAAVHATPDLFVEFKVNGASVFTTRPRLGAVPYALEADTARVARRGLYENPTTMNETSFGGGYCGLTAQGYNGAAVGGYAGGRAKCQAVAGCGATAHMCSSDEMVRYAATGGTHAAADAWIASGAAAQYASSQPVEDCKGFTSNVSSEVGVSWEWTAGAPAGYPHLAACTVMDPIACCD